MAIKCCQYCVPPKRYPGCKGSCPDYIIDNAFHQVEKEEQNKKNATNAGLYKQREKAIAKVTHNSRRSVPFRTKSIK